MWWLWLLISIVGLIVAAFGIMATIGLWFRCTTVKCTAKRRLEGKTALVTGGTAGMGLEIAKEFASRGARVIIACPFQQEGDDARELIVKETNNKDVTFKMLNLASFKSVRAFAEDILKTEQRLDLLMNNAGVLLPNAITPEGFNFIMQVNYLGTFLLTILLLPLLKKSGTVTEKSRIVNTSSLSHSMGKINLVTMKTKSSNPYPDSKLCVAMFTRELAKRLQGSPIIVNTVDPGIAVTNIGKGFGKILIIMKLFLLDHVFPSAWHGAQTAMHVALDEKAGGETGKYFSKCAISPAHSSVYDNKVSELLWNETVKFIQLNDSELKNLQ